MIIVDASVVVTGLGDDRADGERVRARLVGEQLIAPHLIDIEAASAWRRLAAAGQLSEDRAEQAVRDLQSMRMQRVAHGPLLDGCWEHRHNLTVYDAAYVTLAERAGLLLLTADAKLVDAPTIRCDIELLR